MSALEARWLAEVVRRREERDGPLDDAQANAAALAAGGGLAGRILVRADVLGAREGWRDAILRWGSRARLMLFAAGLLALLAGFGAAAGVLGDGSRPVNVVWAVGGLLGVHAVSLVLWLVLTPLAGRGHGLHAGGLLGRGWLKLVALADRSAAAADLPAALGGLLGRGRAAAWGLGAVSHGLWALLLAGAAVGVLALLATRRYGFVWETTILSAETFVAFAAWFGALPGALGFPVPDAATVAASGESAMLEEAGRRAWAGWLLGGLLVYGLLPRVALAALCAFAWRRATAALALDLSRPGYARLRFRLQPASERLGVSDPEQPGLPGPRHHAVAAVADGEAVLLGLELEESLPWPPACGGAGWPAGVRDGGRLDGRAQRQAALQTLAQHPPRRLLVVVDARQTPDRGSLGFIAEVADHAVETRVWAPHGGARSAQWAAGLVRIGLGDDAFTADGGAARAWLGGEEGGRV
ncbi:DUF2868 domain-containing protein [Pseudothauera rhizosphaerae]|uniref:DUF2868 domain-containing protein n=1 Tax=Pseudothauera rhizosphaerae TaxID=2565932 RepID=A0A4S4B0Q0_9RHOO|nr:DUF2868 domain-containing protein [Pseudothauera rhizosphaerae]